MEFYKEKDFGELISAPFIFFIKEIKPFLTGLLFFVGPFILLESVLIGYFNFSSTKDIFMQIQNLGTLKSSPSYVIPLIEFLKNVMLYTFISAYVKIYITQGAGNIETDDIWREIKRFFWPVAGGQILGGIIIVLGFIFIIIPGIYLAVALSPLFVIIVFEEKGVLNSFSRSFELIKGRWWLIFGLFVLLFIMLTTVSGIISLITGAVLGFASQGSLTYILSTIFDLSFELLISTFMILLPVFLYGHLISEKEQPELRSKINKIADAEDNMNETNDENVPENRFAEDNDDTDRFKPKY